MSGLARGHVDDQPIHVGDQVLVRGWVLRSVAGVGALVRFRSKTEEYEGWICEEDLRWPLLDDKLAAEPENGTWLLVDGSARSDGNPLIFHRDDAEGHFDPDRRHQQHWFDLIDQQWIDWPAAVARGAAAPGVRRMSVEEGD